MGRRANVFLNATSMHGNEIVRVRPLNCYGPQNIIRHIEDLFQVYLSFFNKTTIHSFQRPQKNY